MKQTTQSGTLVRAVNGLIALAFAMAMLGAYWPTVKTFDLYRADPGFQGDWIEGHVKLVTQVTPGGPADRAGIEPGDMLQFDASRNDDWVLAGYRNMPEGFTGTLSVLHANGTQATAALTPARVAYLPTATDRIALVARLCGVTLLAMVGVFMVWARPSLMTWSMYLGVASAAPFRVWVPYYFAFKADAGFDLAALLPASAWPWSIALVPFGLCFPHDTPLGWTWWQRALVVMLGFATVLTLTTTRLVPEPFVRDPDGAGVLLFFTPILVMSVFAADLALAQRYRRSGTQDRARLKWVLLGISVSLLAPTLSFSTLVVTGSIAAHQASGSVLTLHHFVFLVSNVVMVCSIAYAVLRERVVDIQFAVSRTVVYGVVSTLALVFLAVLHWLLGRMIEQSRLAFGIEGLAAIGLGLVLHRASHSINVLVDRVLFRKHHAAEERLRQVTAALPFAGTEQSIADAVVNEPVRHLELASAALFYRESAQGPLQRVLSRGWGGDNASSLDADNLLVRYLQAEHAPFRLDGEHEWLPPGMPEGSAHPVLAVPVLAQHELNAVVLYGAHVDSTLPDPDEVDLLGALGRAAAISHQQVRIKTLMREKAAAEREAEIQTARNAQLEASLHALALAGRDEASPATNGHQRGQS